MKYIDDMGTFLTENDLLKKYFDFLSENIDTDFTYKDFKKHLFYANIDTLENVINNINIVDSLAGNVENAYCFYGCEKNKSMLYDSGFFYGIFSIVNNLIKKDLHNVLINENSDLQINLVDFLYRFLDEYILYVLNKNNLMEYDFNVAETMEINRILTLLEKHVNDCIEKRKDF